MKNEIYNPMEQVLIQGLQLAQAMETKRKTADLLALDLLLLELEVKADMMDGIKLQEWLL